MAKTKRRRLGVSRKLRTQREVLRDVMLSANECGAWLTLAELAAMTRYPAASISAQLRHLKKPQFGNYEVKKQLRAGADWEDGHGPVWEYRLTRKRRVLGKEAVRESARRTRHTATKFAVEAPPTRLARLTTAEQVPCL